MHLKFKKVVTHNNWSRADHVECPYYTEIDNILKGDASITPLCIVWSLQLSHTLAPQAATAATSQVIASLPTRHECGPFTGECALKSNRRCWQGGQ